MTDRKNIFLTENRREVLEGTSDWEQASIQNEKSRIKNRAGDALEELIEVAESPHIDHTDALDPDDVFRLLRALLTPMHRLDEMDGGLIGREDYPDDFQPYHDRLRMQMAKLALASTVDMSQWTDENAPGWQDW